jgi:hypothetical protein
VRSEIDIHELEEELSWVGVQWYWEPQGLELRSNAFNRTEVMRFPTRKEK